MDNIPEIALGVWAASSIPAAILIGIVAALWLLVKAYELGDRVRAIIRYLFGKDKS